jgi:group I intron endonuclease
MNVVYKITCVKNEKFYIGSSSNLRQRWAKHRRQLRQQAHPNRHMQASWDAHGEESFVFEILEEVTSGEALFAAEQRYLDESVGLPNCFNWAKYAGAPMRGKSGADTPNYGKVFSETTKQKLREANSGKNNPCWGAPVPEERKARIRASNLAHPHRERRHTPEAKAKIAAASKGRPCSEETRRKRSIALKGREIPLEQRLRTSRTLSGEGNFWYGKNRPESFCEKVRRRVLEVSTNMEFPSIKHAREHYGITATGINRALKSGQPITKGQFMGLVFQYIDPPPAT